jgi:hypothetical protein
MRMAVALILRFNIKFHQSLIGLWPCPPIFLSSSVLTERHRVKFAAFALSTFHFTEIHFGPRPYITPLIVLVLSLVFVEYLPTCRSLKPDGE